MRARPGTQILPHHIPPIPTFRRPQLPPHLRGFHLDPMQEKLLQRLRAGVRIHFHGQPIKKKPYQLEKKSDS